MTVEVLEYRDGVYDRLKAFNPIEVENTKMRRIYRVNTHYGLCDIKLLFTQGENPTYIATFEFPNNNEVPLEKGILYEYGLIMKEIYMKEKGYDVFLRTMDEFVKEYVIPFTDTDKALFDKYHKFR